MKNPFKTTLNTINRVISTYVEKQNRGNLLDISDRIETNAGTPREQTSSVSIEEMWDFYERSEFLRATIDRIVFDTAIVNLRAAPKNRTAKASARAQKRVIDVQDLLDDPNKNDEPFFSVRSKMLRDLLVMDSGCIEVVYDQYKDRPAELYAVSGKWITKNTDEKGNFKNPTEAYYLEKNKKILERFEQREIVFLVATPVAHSVYGMSRVSTLSLAIACDILASLYNAAFFSNYGETSGILSFLNMGKKELGTIRQYWRSKIKGKPHKLLLTNKETNFTRMALTNKDMEFIELQRLILQKIMSNYGMQPLILGIRDPGTGRLNSIQQNQAYVQRAIKPLVSLECYHYTSEIVRAGFGYKDVVIIPEDIDRMDVITQTELDRSDAVTGILTVNEIRARRGMPSVSWGDSPPTKMFGTSTKTKPGPASETPPVTSPEEREKSIEELKEDFTGLDQFAADIEKWLNLQVENKNHDFEGEDLLDD